MGYTIGFCRKTLGSFWKTNPPVRLRQAAMADSSDSEGVLEAEMGSVWRKIGGHRPPLQRRRSKRGPYTILRNEPISNSRTFLCISDTHKYLCTFAAAFANGFVLENEPIFKPHWGSFPSRIPKLTPMHPPVNVTRHAEY